MTSQVIAGDAVAESGVETSQPPTGRHVVILLDRFIAYGRAASAARKLAEAVVTALGATDRAVVVSPISGVGRRDFTTDKRELLAEIGRVPIGASLSPGVVVERGPNEGGECACGLCSIDLVTEMARRLADLRHQPKVMFFISSNIPPLAFERADYLFDPCAPSRIAAVEEMNRSTGNANLVVHTVDPQGLEPPAVFSAARRANGTALVGSQAITGNPNTLLFLADMTGGQAVLNSNDAAPRVRELLRESGAFYVLGWAADSARGRVGRIEVRVKRSGLRALARRPYSGVATDGSSQE